MKKLQRKLTGLRTFLTLIGLLALDTTLFYFSAGLNIKNFLSQTTVKQTKIVPPSQFNGWVAWWDEAEALESLNKSSKILKSASPVWYRINNQGTIEIIPHKLETQITSILQRQAIKLIPTITNDFDPKRISFILNNTDISRRLEENLKTVVLNSNYQGIDIDWEEIDPKDQEAFTLFIQSLSTTFHQAGLIVTVSVHPQTGKTSDRAVAKGYNLKALSQNVDAIKIMAYDFHNQNSKPGAVTPINELGDVIKFVSSNIPAEKIILGLPVYGYNWEIDSKKAAEAVTFKQASDKIKANSGQTQRDLKSNSLVGRYNINGLEHIIWFEDAKTITEFIELARASGIYQFSFWRLGAEDPDLWTNLLYK